MDELKKAYLLLVILTLVLYLALGGIGLWFWFSNNARIQDGNKAHQAICLLEIDLKKRVSEGHKFLLMHPNGIPGISVTDIRRSLDGQEKTIKSLVVAEC